MLSSHGDSVAMNAISVSTGLNTYQESPVLGKRMRGFKFSSIPDGALPPLNEDLVNLGGIPMPHERMIRAFSRSLEICMAGRNVQTSVPIFLNMPEVTPGVNYHCSTGDIFDWLELQSEISFDRDNSRLIHLGRAGGVQVFDLASAYLQQTGGDYAIIGGMDSPYDLARLSALDRDFRVLHSGASDAFALGEAASCILLTTRRGLDSLGIQRKIRLTAPSIAYEKGHLYSENPNLGHALDEAAKSTLNQLGSVSCFYTTLNGENFFSKELGVMRVRNNQFFLDSAEMLHPADCFGDIGAASAVSMVCIAGYNLSTGNHHGNVLICCASDGELRATIGIALEK